jgi:hypothetical protein
VLCAFGARAAARQPGGQPKSCAGKGARNRGQEALSRKKAAPMVPSMRASCVCCQFGEQQVHVVGVASEGGRRAAGHNGGAWSAQGGKQRVRRRIDAL